MNKIVIVEDTNVLKLRLSAILRKNDFTEIDAFASKMFREKYLSYGLEEAKLFVVDLDAYGTDGVSVVEYIKDANLERDIRIMGICKNPNIRMLKKAVLAGCDDLVIKPFNNEIFIHKVKKLFGLDGISEKSPNHVLAADVELESSSRLNWDDNFKINVEQIDEEHKSLINAYDKLYQLMKSGKGHHYYNELLVFLNHYIDTHFQNEQGIHAATEYPLRFEHIEIHKEFENSIAELYEVSNKEQVTDLELIKINLFIKNWLIHHIMIEDHKFGEFYKQVHQK